jgi:phosphoribosylformylglycinamidine cyclo-ligase
VREPKEAGVKGPGLTYESCGVSVAAQDEAIHAFRPWAEESHIAAKRAGAGQVLAGIGSFGAVFAPDLRKIERPVLVSSTDGIGTKVMLHARFGTHEWAGRDLVAAVVNDILCQGAQPMFFLDYLACHKVEPLIVEEIVGGMAKVCTEIGCALVGGEIAEMGKTYRPGDYDLAGFAVGVADAAKMWGPRRVTEGSILIGLQSSGVHCNGYSLVRRIFEPLSEEQWEEHIPKLGGSLKDRLLAPSHSYAAQVRLLQASTRYREDVQAAAHISGGGLQDNMPRVIPQGLCAVLNKNAVKALAGDKWPIFDIIRQRGRVDQNEMWHVFNMGVGFVFVVSRRRAHRILELLATGGIPAAQVGQVVKSLGSERFAWGD